MALLRAVVVAIVVAVGLVTAASADARPLVWVSVGPEGGEVVAIVADPSVPGVVYGSGAGGVFRSTDGGVSWARSDAGLGGSFVVSLAVEPGRPGVVYAGTEGRGVFRSVDGGASWQEPAGPDGEIPYGVSALAVVSSTGAVFAGAFDGLFVSEDGGVHWRLLPSPFVDDVVVAISLAGADSEGVRLAPPHKPPGRQGVFS